MITRPTPPPALCEPGRLFASAPGLKAWAEATLLDRTSPLFNHGLEHLLDDNPIAPPGVVTLEAGIVWCWTNWPGRSRGREIGGLCELYPKAERQWPKARGYASILRWWEEQGGDPEETPDFIVTLYAPGFAAWDDRTCLATTDHELTHCGAQLDEGGEVKYTGEGRPTWRIRPHDIEEHVSIVERYGAYSPDLQRLKRALNSRPAVSDVELAVACGTCGRLAA